LVLFWNFSARRVMFYGKKLWINYFLNLTILLAKKIIFNIIKIILITNINFMKVV
jgi:hypothetical protein